MAGAGGIMSQDIPIRFGTPDEREEFWRSFNCCWDCFEEELRGRGYDIEFYEDEEYDD